LSDGRAIDDQFPIGQWPLKLISFKSNTMSSSTAVIPRLHHVKQGTAGAIRMAGEAALRTGAGLVRVLTRGENIAPLLTARPELM
ncbi:hypothetical protein MJM45_31795, partial [Salmonella enterica subsp. enterica serovar Kentucky]|nr:hypothetical protein [Salmonella enterica subsp. enterica serovar Kentucky]